MRYSHYGDFSRLTVSMLSFEISFFFVVFHLRGGEGVLLGDGVNGAEEDGLITESKFVFLL